MSRQWFLFESSGITVDLSQITQVCWNFKLKNQDAYATLLYFGVDVFYLPEGKLTGRNLMYVCSKKDRLQLQMMLAIDMGLPTIKLLGIDEPIKLLDMDKKAS